MSSIDRSSTERLRQLRSRILAASISKGLNPNDSGTWQDIKVGRGGYVIQLTGSGNTVTIPGCCNTAACLPVCDLSGEILAYYINVTNPYTGPTDLSGIEVFLSEIIVGTPTVPPPINTTNYQNNYAWVLYFPESCNATTYSVTMVDSNQDPVEIDAHYLGLFPSVDDPAVTRGVFVIYVIPNIPGDDWWFSTISLTISNSCSSVTDDLILGCFIAGTPVALADGTTKAIEDVVVGDLVVGAFGEANPVLALHRPLLGDSKVCRLNDEHTTTTHHPHIAADRKFYCPDPDAIKRVMYGKTHTIIHGDGSTEERLMTGVNPDRIKKLELGTALQTITGPRSVAKIEPLPMSADTQVYHLVVGGSHTYTVDGYAVVGWATETDFDYDNWTARSS